MVPDPLAVAALGLAVFALPAGSKRAVPGWHSRCTADPAAVAAGWRPGDNVGVGCRASGIVGVDLDRHDGGPDGCETFAALCARARAPWPSTLTVQTAHGGLHLYFRAPAGVPVASAIARWPGIDIRGPGYRLGGYLAGPGSVVDGQPYIIERDVPIRDLPAWLAGILDAPAPASGSATHHAQRANPPWTYHGDMGGTAKIIRKPAMGRAEES